MIADADAVMPLTWRASQGRRHCIMLDSTLLPPHIRFGSSQTLQNLTKYILKNINIYHTKYISHETTFRNESNKIDLAS